MLKKSPYAHLNDRNVSKIFKQMHIVDIMARMYQNFIKIPKGYREFIGNLGFRIFEKYPQS